MATIDEYEKEFRRACRRLRHDFPAKYKVIIRLVKVGTVKDESGGRLHGRAIQWHDENGKRWWVVRYSIDDGH